jgi:hypothetical protein
MWEEKMKRLSSLLFGTLVSLPLALAPLSGAAAFADSSGSDCSYIGSPVTVPSALSVPAAETSVSANCATDRSGLVLKPTVDTEGQFSTVRLRVESTSSSAIRVSRVKIRPPQFAVVDGTTPSVSRNENGVTWYTDVHVVSDHPLVGYEVRVWGPADGAVVEINWSTSKDNGVLQVTISGAPAPKPLRG